MSTKFNHQLSVHVPTGWKVSLLDTLTKRGSGHTPDKAFDEYYNGGIKWISLADSYRLDNGTILDTDFKISQLGIEKSSAVIHPKGTVLMSRDAGVGKSAIMGDNMAVSQHFITWVCKEDLDNWFLYYWLQYHKGYFEKQAVGSTIKTIGLPLFKKLLIKHPEYSEQKEISNFIYSWDKIIQTNRDIIVQKKNKKKWLMRQLLTGRQRLNGFDKNWCEIFLGDFITESRIPSLYNDVGKRLTVRLNLKGIENRSVRGSEAEDGTSYFIRKAGQFIYGKQNLHKGAFGIIPKELDNYESSQDLPAFDFVGEVDPVFFLYFLSQDNIYQELEKYSTGTGSKRIHPESLFKVKYNFPEKTEQTAIAKVLQTSDKEIHLLKAKTDKLKDQKKGIMQLLLTGKKRLSANIYKHS